MGYHDSEYPNPMSIFQSMGEADVMGDAELHGRMQVGQGRPLFHLHQLDAFYIALEREPQVCLEYDRFLPSVPLNRQ